ncbi:peptidylprolyl isomerase [Psychromonas sp. psych-6C06]|uniref:peptidylprolyl isomerase n=1 Tax=Psychromonas sp. psych-6C06 TaxID=2058089 RepID=UPI000C337CD7|nr:peptidylprolyl isomerase [Psychromonas sp. psych-6C06]PKF63598.1 peptidylprolyl isomerase [Psychromonas sp. psych-6C06]
MLDKMREGSQGVAAKVILVVIILSFALAGVSSYLGGSNVAVAVYVNDQEISQASVEQAYQNERGRLQQQYGEQFEMLAANPNFAQQVRAQATQGLISDALIEQAIEEMGLRVGDEQVKDEIRNMSEFQVDGKFNNDQYLALLRRASYTPAQFSQSLKVDLVRRQLLQMLVGSEFVLPTEVDTVNQLQAQQRVAKVLLVSASDFENAEPVTDEEINAYYQSNSAKFQSPEQVSVNYVLLDGSTLTDQVDVTDADIEAYYDLHQSDYQRAERRKVAHILVQGVNDESLQKAQQLLAEINAGADFAKLAAEKSDDTFSAANNGELDWFEPGVMDPEFDKASFALTESAPVSEVVKSEFGYHIIKLVDIDNSETLPLAEVKQRVEVALKKSKINDLYFELHQSLSEVAFESPDNLEEAAGAISTEVQHTPLFSANNAPEILSNRAVLQTVFDQNFRDEGMNSELIELADDQAIVVRVNDYKPAALMPLEDVSTQIKAALALQKSESLARDFVKGITDKLNANQSVEAELSAKDLAFSADLTFARYSREYDYQVIQQLFKMVKPEEGQVSRQWVKASSGDFAVVELSKVVETDPSLSGDEVKTQIESMLERSTSDETYQALVAHLIANADIKYPVQE